MIQLNYTNDSKPRHLWTLGHQSPRTSHSMISLKATLRRSFPDGEKWHICSESLCCRKFWNCPLVDLIIFNTLSERSLQKKKKIRYFPYFLHLYPVYSHTPGPQAALLFLNAFSSDTGLMEAWTVQIKSDLFQSELGHFDIWLSIRYTLIFDYYSKAKVCLEQCCKLQFLDLTISSNINVWHHENRKHFTLWSHSYQFTWRRETETWCPVG